MEVHHHSHTERKKWTHYVWEFLMLFFAVTLGFFVENQREHFIEHKRAKEYAILMVGDLKKDTTFYSRTIKAVEVHVKNFDTVSLLFDLIPQVPNNRLINAVLPQRTTYPLFLFPTTFNQMKNSGTIRYFHTNLSREVSDYYDIFHPALKQAFDYNDQFFTTEVQTFMINHFDYSESSWFDDTLLVFDPTYLERSQKTDILLRNRLILYTSLLKFTAQYIIKDALARATKLIDILNKEYHL